MSTSLVIKIFGGVCGGIIGTYVSKQFYEYYSIYINPLPQIKLSKLEINENSPMKVNKQNYDYDNEHGNSIEYNIEETVSDYSYFDFYEMVGR